MGYYSESELSDLGFAHIGLDVKLSKLASLYGTARISIGDHSRIDDFCVISAGIGGIEIGRYVHIAVMCSLIGDERISMGDFSGLSSRVSVYSSSDDYGGKCMTNPTVPTRLKNVDSRPVFIGKHCIVGAGSVILPGTNMGEGAALGSLSLARGNLNDFTIYSGVPAKEIKTRGRELLQLEQLMDDEE